MILVRLKSVVCHAHTESGGFGIGVGDEPYLSVTAAALTVPPAGVPPVPLGSATVLYVLQAPMVAGGRAQFGTPGNEFQSFWGLDGMPNNLINPEAAIFVVSLMEHDNGDPVLYEGSVNGAAATSLAATLTSLRQVKIDRLIRAIDVSRRLPTGVPDIDTPIDVPKELKFTTTELMNATAGQSVRRSLTFQGEGGRYTLEFEATIARQNARDIAAISTVEGGTSLFIIDADGGVQTKFYDPRVQNPTWSPWRRITPLELDFRQATLTAVSTMTGGASLFVVGADRAVWSAYCGPQVGAPWSDWFRLSNMGDCDSGVVAAISTVPGGTSLFISDGAGKVRSRYYDPRVQFPKWTPPDDAPWLELSANGAVGGPSHNVAAVSTVPGGSSLYVVDGDRRLHTSAFDPKNGNTWGPWLPMSGPQQALYPGQQIVAVRPTEGSTCLVMVQDDGSVGVRWFLASEGNWSKWKTISPGKFTENVIATCTDGEVHIFAVDERRILRYYHEGTDDWTLLSSSGFVWHGMAAVSTVTGGISVFVIDEIGGVQYTFKDPHLEQKSWHPWQPI